MLSFCDVQVNFVITSQIAVRLSDTAGLGFAIDLFVEFLKYLDPICRNAPFKCKANQGG